MIVFTLAGVGLPNWRVRQLAQKATRTSHPRGRHWFIRPAVPGSSESLSPHIAPTSAQIIGEYFAAVSIYMKWFWVYFVNLIRPVVGIASAPDLFNPLVFFSMVSDHMSSTMARPISLHLPCLPRACLGSPRILLPLSAAPGCLCTAVRPKAPHHDTPGADASDARQTPRPTDRLPLLWSPPWSRSRLPHALCAR